MSDEVDEGIHGINVTPLVDIVLVLLIVLMVAASYTASRAIPMDLPGTDADSEPSAEPFTVSIEPGGVPYLNGARTTWAGLRSSAEGFARAEADPRAVVYADPRVSHGDFVHAVDTLRGAGIDRYAILVNRDESDEE